MDPRFYIYEYRRSRANNPTYNSNAVSSSLSVFQGGPLMSTLMQNQLSTADLVAAQDQSYRDEGSQKLRSASHLSHYGTNTLKSSQPNFVKAQESPVLGRYFEQTKVDRRQSISDQDAFYLKKLTEMNRQIDNRLSVGEPVRKNPLPLAGIHTYAISPQKGELPQGEIYGGGKGVYGQFRPQMLNHTDELRSLS